MPNITTADDLDGKPATLAINTTRGTVTLSRIFESDEHGQIDAHTDIHTAQQEDEELAELPERSVELEQRFIDQVRAVLTVQQRQTIANF